MPPANILSLTRKVLALVDRRYIGTLVLLLMSTLLASVLEVLSVTAVLPVFQLLLDPRKVSQSPWFQRFFGATEPKAFLLWVCLGIIILFVLKMAVSLFSLWLKWLVQSRLQESLSTRLLNSYLYSPISFHLKHSSSELLRNLNAYVSQTTQYGLLDLVDLLSDCLLGIGMFIALVIVDPVVSTIAVISLGVVAGLYVAAAQPYFVKLGLRYKVTTAKVFQTATEALVGIKTVKVLGCEAYFEDLYQRYVREFCDILRNMSFVTAVPRQVLELIAVIALIGLIAMQVAGNGDPAALIPVLAVFAAATYRLMPAVVRIMTSLQNLRFSQEGIEAVYLGIRGDNMVPRRKLAARSKLAAGDIVLTDVMFSYGDAPKPALDRINLQIRNGEAAAFVGSSGAGKTTLADLILGLHAPESGTFTIDGNNVASGFPSGTFGYVPQDPFLVDDTIRRNIALGVADKDIDHDQLDKAIRTAALDEFFASLPNGLDTRVGDRGVRLSGGQRQRIGIARALYVNPDILVMDEATSSVDMTTEMEISDAINRLRGAKTLIVIAHRLSTVRECDCIYYLDKGRVVASGRFDELVRANAQFAAMVKQMSQLSPVIT